MAPGNVRFTLRWQLAQFLMGLCLTGMSAFIVWTTHCGLANPVQATRVIHLLGPFPYLGLVSGLLCMGNAWRRAGRLRRGG